MNQSSRFLKTVYELSSSERTALSVAEVDVPKTPLPDGWQRDDNGLPELSELDVARHYLALAQRNFGVESGMYPLGSCTMKYNPKIGENLSRLSGFVDSHPGLDDEQAQGNLKLIYQLQQWLQEIGGFSAISLQPSAGAHGEFTALLMIKAWHRDNGEDHRNRVLVPDSAHGTNPASTTMASYQVVELPTDERGNVDTAALKAACDERVAAIMLTNPNTLGLFDENLGEITRAVHDCGGLVYGDGANMNALTGILQPAQTGIDLMHYNLHKTFGTPHGGGGPGSGPIATTDQLADYLPGPIVVPRSTLPSNRYVQTFDKADKNGKRELTGAETETSSETEYVTVNPARSIGRLSHHYGNFGVFTRAYSYIRGHGNTGLRKNALHAVLNANYLRCMLKDTFNVPFNRTTMHEFVCEGRFEDSGIRAIDISKQLIDCGIHPPTNYFPLIVKEALMIEPTECESLETLDEFIDVMLAIAEQAKSDPGSLHQAPQRAAIGRVDETYAARHLKLHEFDL